MMRWTANILLIAAAVLTLSCEKRLGEAGEVRNISVRVGDTEVKTAFNASHTSINWSEGDCISAFHNAEAGNLQN